MIREENVSSTSVFHILRYLSLKIKNVRLKDTGEVRKQRFSRRCNKNRQFDAVCGY